MQTVLDDCLDCLEELDHCHGLLVLHTTGVWECEVPSCDGAADLHEYLVQCIDLPTGCPCDRPRHRLPLAA